MKKLATLLTLMVGAGFAFGQAVQHFPGAVLFVNTESGKDPTTGKVQPSHLVTNLTGGLLVGTQYKAELYYQDPNNNNALTPLAGTISSFKSTTATTGLGTWAGPGTAVALPTTPTPGNPTGLGGVDADPINGELGVDAAGYTSPNGDGFYPVQCQVVVWDSTTGSSYESATVRGQSAVFTFVQRFAGGGSPPPITSDTQLLQMHGFAIVPEPSAIALSVLGVAGLLLFRRRK